MNEYTWCIWSNYIIFIIVIFLFVDYESLRSMLSCLILIKLNSLAVAKTIFRLNNFSSGITKSHSPTHGELLL